MYRQLKAVLCIIISLSILFNGSLLNVLADVNETTQNSLLYRYDDVMDSGNVYSVLTNELDFLYKQWNKTIENESKPVKILTWCSNMLLDKNVDKEAYRKYLSTILTMIDNGFAKSTESQSLYTNKMTAYDYTNGIVKISLEAFMGNDYYSTLKNSYSLFSESYDLSKIGKEMTLDMNQMAVASVSTVGYKNKIKFLESVKSNTQSKALQKAADELIDYCNIEYVYILDAYLIKSTEKLTKIDAAMMDIDAYKTITETLKKTVGTKLKPWIQKFVTEETLSSVLKCASTIASYANLITTGFKIGSEIMKLLVGNQAELFREMRALDDISDALIIGISNSQKGINTEDKDVRYDKIQEFVVLCEALLYTHLRGEYCDVNARTGKAAVGAQDYYQEVEEKLNNCYTELYYILNGGDIQVVNKGFSLSDSFINKVDEKTAVPDGYIGVYSFEDLKKIADNTDEYEVNEYSSANYILMNNIICPSKYEKIDIFTGVLDGNGYMITNISTPLFGMLQEAEVRNLSLSVSAIIDYSEKVNYYVSFGALAESGGNRGTTVIDNCYVNGNIKITSSNLRQTISYVGGIIGQGNPIITNCYNSANIVVNSDRTANVGGIIGRHDGNNIGASGGDVINCYNIGNITVTPCADSVGGIMGSTYDTDISFCYNEGNISAGKQIGGICGYVSLGNSVVISDCYNTGSVRAYHEYSSEYLNKKGTLYEMLRSAGGVVGYSTAGNLDIKRCSNLGSILGLAGAGGIVGYSSREVELIDSYNIGDIKSDEYTGGLIGRINDNGEIMYCYNAGSILGGNHKGTIVGNVDSPESSLKYNYYLDSGIPATGSGANLENVIGVTEEQIKRKDTFEVFDFNMVWKNDDSQSDYPIVLRHRNFEIEEDIEENVEK